MSEGRKRAFRPGLAASLATLAAFTVLVGLGVWQLQRLEWKQGLIADMRLRAEATPITSLPPEPLDIEDLSFHRARLTGHFVAGAEFHLPGRSFQGMTGSELAAAFVTEEGRGIIVSRGWLPPDKQEADARPELRMEGLVTIEGILRPSGWRGSDLFRPANDPEKNVWLYYDGDAMAARAGLEDPVQGLYLSLTDEPGERPLPVPLPPAVTLVNNHLEYALTWFALAGGLIAIFLLFGFSRGRDREERDAKD
jgi:surfeit locus 1 family protein